MNTSTLKLPRSIEIDPRRAPIEEILARDPQPLWQDGRIAVPTVSFTEAFEKELIAALGFNHVERGLENIEKILEREKKGLAAVQAKQGTAPANRASRLLIIASDGTERFFRGCESLLYKHSDRLLGMRLDVTSERLSSKLFGPEKQVKALLITDRDAVARLLLSVVS